MAPQVLVTPRSLKPTEKKGSKAVDEIRIPVSGDTFYAVPRSLAREPGLPLTNRKRD
jgi:hypothetical protein